MAAIMSALDRAKAFVMPAVGVAAAQLPVVAETLRTASADAAAFAMTNPGTSAVYAAAAVGAVVTIAPAIVASPALAAAGFAADGVVKGSVAAGVQAGIGNVVAPGLFATLQSAGAGGYGVAAVSAGVSAVSGTASALAAGAAWMFGG
ncbi:hypothetical protein F503_03186 [Ophiostoma piceae UAMH 11346]|uniref:Interferon-induced 6-16 n=1 Tax=Ophiostoma piceae (strain UAMH 11346) TaxID=1262450 RepID=S3BZR6_OPHP1|nr:hypothetical protein F503_03186 [Ophiostoma piceae UAMH 11346]